MFHENAFARRKNRNPCFAAVVSSFPKVDVFVVETNRYSGFEGVSVAGFAISV